MNGGYFALALICTVIGLAAGLLAARTFFIADVGAILHIDKTNPEKDIYKIELIIPFEELDKLKYVRMKIKKHFY